jgi:hypothetical protein
MTNPTNLDSTWIEPGGLVDDVHRLNEPDPEPDPD